MAILRIFVPAAFVALALSGCYASVNAGPPAGGCAGGHWVEAHRGPRGELHERHWWCPGEREE